MGWLIELAKEAIPEPMPEPGAKPETSPSPADLATLLAEACKGVPGIDPATFKSLLSPVDVEDIEGGHIPVVTLRALRPEHCGGHTERATPGAAAANPRTSLPLRVRCADCRHFERDTIGDGSGIGRCNVGGEGAGPRHPALWANAERECRDFEAR